MGSPAPGSAPAPDEALARLIGCLVPLPREEVRLEAAIGRVLATNVHADRPAPPVDVSAVDGFALRLREFLASSLPVTAEARIGREVPVLGRGHAMRIFTGGPLPLGADSVVKQEDVQETDNWICPGPGFAATAPGCHIRRQGENAGAGQVVLEAGRILDAPAIGILAYFGIARPTVRRRVRVAVLATGDELARFDREPSVTGIRDSNGPSLAAMLEGSSWIRMTRVRRVPDRPRRIETAVASALAAVDVILLTGGVSRGAHDHVPDVVKGLGADILFHGVAMRPGGPLLGGVAAGGRVILGLPGNPVAVLVGARRFAVPVLRYLAGLPPERVRLLALEPPESRVGDVTRFPLVRRVAPGRCTPVPSRGSGDLVASAHSDGFLEIAPGILGPGPFRFLGWERE